MRTSKRIFALLVVFAFLGVNGPADYAQDIETAEVRIQRDRLHLRAADWQVRAKTTSGVRLDDAVRLRSGATKGHVTSIRVELPFNN